jgi:hypothetical protein
MGGINNVFEERYFFFFFLLNIFFLDFFIFFSLDYRISHVSIFFSNYCVIDQYMFNNIINALRSDYCIMFRQYTLNTLIQGITLQVYFVIIL